MNFKPFLQVLFFEHRYLGCYNMSFSSETFCVCTHGSNLGKSVSNF